MKPARVGGLAEMAGVGLEASPLPVPGGFQPQFADDSYGTERTGPYGANSGLDVVVTTDNDQERNSRLVIVFQRGDDGGGDGIRNRRYAKPAGE